MKYHQFSDQITFRNDNFELFTSYNYYCAWTHNYEIDNFNILLCDACLQIFKEVLESFS